MPVPPSLSRIIPKRAAPGEEVQIEGSSGLIELRKDDGTVTGYIESAKSFALLFDGEPIATIDCYVNTCRGNLTVPSYAVPGDHEVSVEGGSVQVLTVTEALAGKREKAPTIAPVTTEKPPTVAPVPTPVPFALRTAAFASGGQIPARYTCDGDDFSPALSWEGAPSGTETYVLVMDDPDAPRGVWDHWVVFNIPAAVLELAEGQPKTSRLPGGGLHGTNSWGNTEYGGPCPPGGPAHTYRFFLYAVDTALDLPVGASKAQVLEAIEGRILEESLLTGTYGR